MTVTFLQLLNQFTKTWCQPLHPERAFRRHWMFYATQVIVCPIQRKTNRCVSFWKHCFLQCFQGARRFLLDPVCLALPLLRVIWISFLIQVITTHLCFVLRLILYGALCVLWSVWLSTGLGTGRFTYWMYVYFTAGKQNAVNISYLSVDGVWIGNWMYWTLKTISLSPSVWHMHMCTI
jgi:hypothetical protein